MNAEDKTVVVSHFSAYVTYLRVSITMSTRVNSAWPSLSGQAQ